MESMSTVQVADRDVHHDTIERSNDSRAVSVKQGMRVAKLDDSFKLTGREKLAGLVTVLMMLGPLAAAAWGAHFGTL